MTHPNLPAPFLALACAAVVMFGAIAWSAPAKDATFPPPDKLKGSKSLPDPFLMRNKSRVKTLQDWEKRRVELREMILHYEYGTMPPAPGNVKAEEDASYNAPDLHGSAATMTPPKGVTLPVPLPQGAVEKKLRLTMGPDSKASTHVVLTVPAGKGPFPAIVKGDLCWGRVRSDIVAEVIRRGYILAEFDRTELAADEDNRSAGVFPLYGDRYDWRDIAAWAWGFHRLTDYLLTRADVDARKIIVTGHSRGGKAALLAGALDDRVSLTNPNGSGCGGAGCYRYQAPQSETIAEITRHFPYWFSTRFPDFIGQTDKIPFDQHEVAALAAPRGLLITNGLDDTWANQEGTQQTFVATKEVYQFLGAPEKIGIHWREGKHEHNAEDWAALLDYADHQLMSKPISWQPEKLHFAGLPKIYTWTAPATPKN